MARRASRAEARRAVEALFARAGDVLTAGVKAVAGQRPAAAAKAPTEAVAEPAAGAAASPVKTPRPAPSGEAAAARLDEARERLRARIAPPAADDDDPA